MTQPFIGQIQPFGFSFAPRNWALCNGQTMSIQQNAALFSLLGTMYGGNGQTTFQLPNLQSRVPMHMGTFNGNTYIQGELNGEENVTLLLNNLPSHPHSFSGTQTLANRAPPAAGAALAQVNKGGAPGDSYYAPSSAPQLLNPASIGPSGGSGPHTNIQPYLTISWCIALYGIFPSRN